MEKIVLEQFGQAWGYADGVDKKTKTVEVYCDETVDGTPVNVKTRKVSSNIKKYGCALRKQGGYVIFCKRIINGNIYYKY